MNEFEKEVKANLKLTGNESGEIKALSQFPIIMVFELDSEQFGNIPPLKLKQYMDNLKTAIGETFPGARSLVLGPGVSLVATMSEGETNMRFVDQIRELADNIGSNNE